jgi:hypothetical protein
VEVAGYGVADAEHLVEKALGRLWPEGRITVANITREGPPRIVEEFEVEYRLEGTVEVEAESPEEASREAFRELRQRMDGSRYARTAWEALGPTREP